MSSLSICSFFLFAVFVKKNVATDSSKELPNSCVGKTDGSYWLQLIQNHDNDYPPIYAKCSNEYTILDYNYDNNVKEYFSSWNYWHYAIAGPDNGDTVNWEKWYSANDFDSKYLVSPDCTTCDEESSQQYYKTKTTYWMTGNMFGCWWNVKGFPVCDLDFDTYTCYYCGTEYYNGDVNPIAIDETSPSAYYAWTGQCVTSIESSQKEVAMIHEDCTSQSEFGIMKPSIGISGKFCVCTQPGKQRNYKIQSETLTTYQEAWKNTVELSSSSSSSSLSTNELTSSNNIVKLYSKDFESGTYRITQPGTYQIMEDIEFDFNKGNTDDPFADGSWWPSSDQAEEYPGAGGYRDPYFLGFFAGITIETSDVVIDLNGHTLKMSTLLYFHQRWFSIIELASQYFLPGQGPGFMGYDPKFASNVVIKNGVLGLSSHFGIHGNFNDNLQILDLKVENFETHGIQLNGWTNVVISNVDIGPSSTQAYLKAEFGHSRVILPRLRKIYEENPDGVIEFTNRNSMTMNDIADELEAQMKMALEWVVTRTDPYADDEETYARWQKAKALFINEDGIPFTSSLTGLFLNLHSASVFTFNLNTEDYSTSAVIENVKIHDLQHSFKEWVRINSGQEIYVNVFTAPMDALSMIGDDELGYYLVDLNDDFSNSEYKGNALTDAYIAMNKLSDNWSYLGGMMVKNDVTVAWAENTSGFPDDWGFGCNVDSMLHSGKGILGFRMDGVKNVEINGLEIYNLYDKTPLGRTECGDYSGYAKSSETRQYGGHFRQLEPIQVGFSGNMVLAMSIASSRDMILKNIDIHDLESETGLIDGIAVWTHCKNITFYENIYLYNFNAGTQVEEGSLSYSDRPNKAPEACAFKIQWETFLNGGIVEDYYTENIQYNDVSNWIVCNIQGHVGCDGGDQYTTEGITSDDSVCSSIIANKKMNKLIQTNHHNFYFNSFIIICCILVSTSILIFLYNRCNSAYNTFGYKYSLIKNYNNINYGSFESNNNQIV